MTRLYKNGADGKVVDVTAEYVTPPETKVEMTAVAVVEPPAPVKPPLVKIMDYVISEGDVGENLLAIKGVDFAVLFDILSTKRRKGGAGDKATIAKYLTSVTTKAGTVHTPVLIPAGEGDGNNIIFDIPQADGSPSQIMWSCHTDSVHHTEGRQWITIDKNGVIGTSSDKDIDTVDPRVVAPPAKNFVLVEGKCLKTNTFGLYKFEEMTSAEAWRRSNVWRDPAKIGTAGYYQIHNNGYTFSDYPDVVFQMDAVRKIGCVPYTNVQKHTRRGECLGGDDGTGMWIMLTMMRAGVPGVYIFHYGEEAGCIGSKVIAKMMAIEKLLPEAEQSAIMRRLLGLQGAVAFDRKGTTEVITHQRGDRCCSDAFAKWLAGAINDNFHEGAKYTLAPSANGVYTDTASYTRLIPECTNIAVGYIGQHGENEVQDIRFLYYLVTSLTAPDFVTRCHTPVIERDPTKVVRSTSHIYHGYGTYGGYGGHGAYGRDAYDDDDFWTGAYGSYGGKEEAKKTLVAVTKANAKKSAEDKRLAKAQKRIRRLADKQDDGTLMWLIKNRPDIIFSFCNQMQVTRRDFSDLLPDLFERN